MGMRKITGFAMFLFAVLSACGQPDVSSEALPKEPLPIIATEIGDKSIVYASDPNARFEILSNKSLPNRNIEVVTKRIGPSGISFSRREISCSNYSYRYLGEGDTLDEALKNGPNIGEMSALTGTSASSDVANEACERK
jgi:hypothetical protein